MSAQAVQILNFSFPSQIGSDIGGSIRIPSNFCGIYGHKTTPDVVSPQGVWPAFTPKKKKLLSLGPICRYVEDVRPMLKVLVGDKLNLPNVPLNYSSTNVYYLRSIDDPFATPVDPEIQQGLDRVLKHFIEKGTRTVELDTQNKFHDFRLAFFLFQVALNDPSSQTHFEVLTQSTRSSINPYLELWNCLTGWQPKYTAAQLLLGLNEELAGNSLDNSKLEKIIERLQKNLHELLANNGVVIAPSCPEVGEWIVLCVIDWFEY